MDDHRRLTAEEAELLEKTERQVAAYRISIDPSLTPVQRAARVLAVRLGAATEETWQDSRETWERIAQHAIDVYEGKA